MVTILHFTERNKLQMQPQHLIHCGRCRILFYTFYSEQFHVQQLQSIVYQQGVLKKQER